MNYRMISYYIGRILLIEAFLLAFPAIGSLIYGDGTLLSFAITIGALTLTGMLAVRKKPEKTSIYAKEGYVIVALTWILMSLFGALPFYISGYIPSFTDAFFETVSGFTTTGATIIRSVEALPKSLLFWRSFTHWIGGMGILVFVIAIMPKTESSSMHVMRAEVPGPTVGKLVSKLRASARILYGIYCVMTAAEIIMLLAGGMPLFDSIVNAFATAGTGGFGVLNNSIESYNSVYAEMVIAVFMLLFGVNFNLYYMFLVKQGKQAIKSEELRWYIGIIACSTLLIAVSLFTSTNNNIADSFRLAFFQVSSIITTTGFSTANFNTWPVISKFILVFLMFIGACAGSTGGGIKVSRLVILVKSGLRDIKKAINPRSIETVKIDKRTVEEPVVKSVSVFFATYMLVMAISMLAVSLDGFNLETTSTAVIACIGNIGPGMGAVGPYGNYADFSILSKLVLSFDMLAGRLELIPMLMLFSPYAWSKKYS